MREFRFGIMGAGNIANKFCDAVEQIEGCRVAAVASKSRERAAAFAEKHGIASFYDSYETMLKTCELDAVYIAATSDAHYALSMLCLDHRVPVLCEKAMFLNGREAEEVMKRAEELQVFVMEAMWSRFLPANRAVREWIRQKRIGELVHIDAKIGFYAPRDFSNRYFSSALGGGAAFDLTVYTYELTTFFAEQERKEVHTAAVWGGDYVDVTDQVQIRFAYATASMTTTFLTNLKSGIEIYCEEGRIWIPRAHFASEAFLYNKEGELIEHYQDRETENGFVYEIREVIECVTHGKIESDVVPHKDTLECARIFDQIYAGKE